MKNKILWSRLMQYKYEIAVFIIVLFALILRLYNLTDQSYWLDELYSAKTSDPDNNFAMMFSETVRGVHPPFYQSLLWVWYQIFGLTEYSGRLLSALVGTLGIFFIYLLGKELFSKEVGVYSALLASVNIFLISYSQEVRSYSLLFLLTAVSLYFFVLFIKDKENKIFVLYLFSIVMLVNTHYFGWLIFFSQSIIYLYFIITEKTQIYKNLMYAFLVVLGVVLSIVPYLSDIANNLGRENFWIEQPEIKFPFSYIKSYFGYSVYLLMAILVMAFIFLRFKHLENIFIKNKSQIIILILIIVVVYGLAYLKGVFGTPILTDRNTIVVVPLLLILFSLLIENFKEKETKIVALVLIVAFSFLTIKDYYNNENRKQQWREVANYVIKSEYPAYDIVDSINRYQFYLKIMNVVGVINSKEKLLSDYEQGLLPGCFWILDAHGDHYKIGDLEYFQKEFEIRFIYQKADANAILYSKPDFNSINCQPH